MPEPNRRSCFPFIEYSMKVAVIEPSGRLYGSEYCLLDVIRGLRPSGFKWEVVLPPGQGFDQVLRDEGIALWSGMVPDLHKLSRWRKMGIYWGLRRHLAGSGADVIYLNQAGMLRAVDYLLTGMKIPLVCQVQTLEDARYISRHPGIQRRVRAFICNSRFIAAEARVPVEKMCILYQGIDFGEMGPEPVAPACGEPWRIGILGRIADSKGHPVFLEAARKLVEHGHNDIRFVVIGEAATEAETEAYRISVREAGLAGCFEFRGYCKDVPSELKRLHLLVIPSRAEPLGRVLLDACQAGIPVIVSDSGGLGEFSQDLAIGFRIPPDDPARLAEEIGRFLLDSRKYTQSFRDAARIVYQRMAPAGYLAALERILKNAASGKNTSIEWFGEP